MVSLLAPRRIEAPRYVLACTLSLIAAALLGGGGYLIALGGSPYYAIAGLAVAASAYGAARGDARGRWVYGAMLVGTLLWALGEGGLDPWALQARLFAPLLLSVWVFWPVLRVRRRLITGAALLFLLALIWLMTGMADRVETPSAPGEMLASGRGDWPNWGNDVGGSRFSPLTQINANNVGQLKEAWRISTGVGPVGIGFEVTPLFVRDTLYLCTPNSIIIALDPDSGARRWTYDPKAVVPPGAACRSVAHYATPGATGACAERILFGTADARLMAVDARTGKPCRDFGKEGAVDLLRGLGKVLPGYYRSNSGPVVVRGKVIVNAWVTDGQYVGEASGVIRAFDAVTGKLSWAWDMDNPDWNGEPPAGKTYAPYTANSWAPMSGDEALGLVYLPMGNATPDYWGGNRSPATEKYSSSVTALDVMTGKPRWVHQTVHHDLWDYDVASQPTLIDLPIGGKIVPALIQPTKQGQIYLLDRRNGSPLARVEERPVPQGAAEGDFLSPTQPFSVGMPAFDDERLSESKMWGTTPLDQLWCRIKFRQARYEGPFTPPGVKPTITYPSYQGGIDWGSVSVDPERRLMVVNWNRVANYTRLVPRAEADAMGVKVSPDGHMQRFLPVPQAGTPFAMKTDPFWSPLLIPCTQPPFGKITVVDLDTRKKRWEKPLGTSRDSGPLGYPSMVPLPMGVPSTGGSITTRSGLVFIAASQEQALRALDIRDGRKLWTARLPAGGQATPMTFVSPKTGKQYVVIAAGGNYPILTKMGDYVVAFALP